MRHSKANQHLCRLLHPEEEVICQFIDVGVCVPLRRWFRGLFQVNKSHPLTTKYFPSKNVRRQEKIRHLARHYLMIHPFSMFRMFWEFFMCVVIFSHFVSIPLNASNQTMTLSIEHFKPRFILESLYLLDVMITFFVGYYDRKNSKVVLNSLAVAKKYLSTYFFFDVLSCMQLYIRLIMLSGFQTDKYSFLYWLRMCNRLKLLRLPRMLNALELFRKYMGFSSYLFKAINAIVIFSVIVFWSFSVTFFIDNYIAKFVVSNSSENSNYTVYESYYDATLLILLVSAGKHSLSEISEYANAVFCLFFGFGLQLFILAQVLQVWTKYYNTEQKQLLRHKQYKQYMMYKKMPQGLQDRICAYLDFKIQTRFFNDSDVARMMSPVMNQEIRLHITKRYLDKVDFFKDLPQIVLQEIISHLKSQIFMPGEVIIRAGTIGNTMYFINHGTVAVYSPRGREICHLEDGAHFGEIALIFSETRVATVVAVTASELYALKRSDLLTAIAAYPELGQRIIKIAESTIKKSRTPKTSIVDFLILE